MEQQQQQQQQAPSTSSASQQQAWLARISAVQREHATPEQMAAIKARSEASRRSAVMAKKASRVQKSLQLSSSAWSAGMQSPEVNSEGGERASVRGRAAQSAMLRLSSPVFMGSAQAEGATLEEEEAAEDALAEAMDQTVALQVAEGTLTMADATAAMAGTDDAQAARLRDALAQLVTEPADAAACAAKFELYEGFAKLTEDARYAVLELWGTAQAEFEGAAATKAQIERDIQAIDRQDRLGIHDDPRKWFVHSMCQAACRNQAHINGVLTSVSAKLELLGSQTECPICLEAFDDAECTPTALSCAHKACEECWRNWVAVRGRRAECPLCRHGEFLDAVVGLAR